MQSPIFLSNEQLNALFNSRDSVIDESKTSMYKIMSSVQSDSTRYNISSSSQNQDIILLNQNEMIGYPQQQAQYHEETGNRKTDKNLQMMMISQEEYYQMKNDINLYEGILSKTRKEKDQLEEEIILKNQDIKNLQDQVEKLNQRDQDNLEVKVLKQQNKILVDQNQRLSTQMRDLLNKNKELVEEYQTNYDAMLKAKLDQQDTKLKYLTLQKDQRKIQTKQLSQTLKPETRHDKDSEIQQQKSEGILRRESNATMSHSSAEEHEKFQKTGDGSPIYNQMVSPQYQWKSNIVYGTKSPNSSQLVFHRVTTGNGAVASQTLQGKSNKGLISPKKQVYFPFYSKVSYNLLSTMVPQIQNIDFSQ